MGRFGVGVDRITALAKLATGTVQFCRDGKIVGRTGEDTGKCHRCAATRIRRLRLVEHSELMKFDLRRYRGLLDLSGGPGHQDTSIGGGALRGMTRVRRGVRRLRKVGHALLRLTGSYPKSRDGSYPVVGKLAYYRSGGWRRTCCSVGWWDDRWD